MKMRNAVVGLLGLLISSNVWASDPVRSDPTTVDAEFPPALVELSFDSYGSKLNGHMYLANGKGPHLTVVMLHGFPGNEKNLDLAQAIRRAGFNALFFHYRGAWGSGGTFSFGNVVDDVASALAFLRDEKSREDLRVDANKLSLVGHSMGGFAALMAGAKDKAVSCTVGIAAANLGGRPADSMTQDALTGFASYTDSLTMLATEGGKAVVGQMLARQGEFDTRKLSPEFAGRSVLLIAGEQDTVLPPAVYHAPLVEAFGKTDGLDLTHLVMQGDHSFSWTRLALAETVVDWLNSHCR